jgi:glycosyltransferase involved in cell wall biosynthesis
MGYGVPFVTMYDSITGGERLNIQHGINGVLLKDLSEMKEIILDITENPQKFVQMGSAARKYYLENRKPEDMANGILSAIEYVTKN